MAPVSMVAEASAAQVACTARSQRTHAHTRAHVHTEQNKLCFQLFAWSTKRWRFAQELVKPLTSHLFLEFMTYAAHASSRTCRCGRQHRSKKLVLSERGRKLRRCGPSPVLLVRLRVLSESAPGTPRNCKLRRPSRRASEWSLGPGRICAVPLLCYSIAPFWSFGSCPAVLAFPFLMTWRFSTQLLSSWGKVCFASRVRATFPTLSRTYRNPANSSVWNNAPYAPETTAQVSG